MGKHNKYIVYSPEKQTKTIVNNPITKTDKLSRKASMKKCAQQLRPYRKGNARHKSILLTPIKRYPLNDSSRGAIFIFD